MSDIAIRVENLSKRYRIGQRAKYKALRDILTDTAKTPVRCLRSLFNGNNHARKQQSEEHIWALKDVSFQIKHGEAVGIIGRNGAGKSTLLKILSRITAPTNGHVDIHGRVGSLLEVGTGFHPELTGRENIFLNGAILGMRRSEIVRKFEEIVSFAEVEKFIDTPVKHYSSGMYVRLAFAVAAHLEPEILVVDEVLAVGDVAFQKKCLGKMGAVAREGRTILFVSHNMGAISSLCQRALLLENGEFTFDSVPESVIKHYLMLGAGSKGLNEWANGIANPGTDEIKIFWVRITNKQRQMTASLDVRESFFIEIHYEVFTPLDSSRLGFRISTSEGIIVFESYNSDNGQYMGFFEPGKYMSECEIPGYLLNVGSYFITINFGRPGVKNFAFIENVISFDCEDTGAVGSDLDSKRPGVTRPKLTWSQKKMDDNENLL